MGHMIILRGHMSSISLFGFGLDAFQATSMFGTPDNIKTEKLKKTI